jgi:hypothetical protein
MNKKKRRDLDNECDDAAYLQDEKWIPFGLVEDQSDQLFYIV